MRPKSLTPSTTDDLFGNRLSNILDQRHALLRLAGLIEWSRFEQEYGALYAEQGRPGLPTRLMVGDSHLLYRGIEWLNRLAKRHGVELRQSFLRLGKYSKREVGRLIHTGGHKQAMRHLRSLKTFLGRLYRDVARKLDAQPVLREICAETMAIVARLLAQKSDDKRKLYALHAPEVECIGKGRPGRAGSSASR